MHFAPSLYVFLPLLSPICFTQFLVPAANEINTSHTTSDSDSDSDPPIFVPPFVRPGHHVNLFYWHTVRVPVPVLPARKI
ncbi:hypothetical protein DFH06DRAFT_1240906, partial [Mycena polygramma]